MPAAGLQADIMGAIAAKMDRYRNPWQELRLQYGANKGKAYTGEGPSPPPPFLVPPYPCLLTSSAGSWPLPADASLAQFDPTLALSRHLKPESRLCLPPPHSCPSTCLIPRSIL